MRPRLYRLRACVNFRTPAEPFGRNAAESRNVWIPIQALHWNLLSARICSNWRFFADTWRCAWLLRAKRRKRAGKH